MYRPRLAVLNPRIIVFLISALAWSQVVQGQEEGLNSGGGGPDLNIPNGIEFDFTSVETDPSLDPGRVLNITPPEPPKTYPAFITGAVKELHASLFNATFNLIINKALFFNKSSPPQQHFTAEEMHEKIDFTLGDEGTSHSDLIHQLEKIIDLSPHTGHVHYLSKLGSGLDPYAIAGDFLASSLSSVLLTFYAAPVFVLMEWEITAKLREVIGYSQGEGITTPGPSFANIMAIQMALYDKNPQNKVSGLIASGATKYVVFLSEDADSSFEKAVILEGLGRQALRWIPTDERGKMDVAKLKAEVEDVIAKNESVPLMIVATAGTGRTGAIDPISQIQNIATEHKIWMHIDGSMSGPLLQSDNYRQLLDGANQSDSFTWSSSFMFGVPETSSFILTSRTNMLWPTFGYNAQYVFASTVLYNHSIDLGDSTIQTCRRPDVLKTHFLWKSKGTKGLQQHVDYIQNMTQEFVTLIQGGDHKGKFDVIVQPESPIVSFAYVPEELRGMDKSGDEYKKKISEFTEKLKPELKKTIQISSQDVKNMTVFTMALTNSALGIDDLAYIADLICGTAEVMDRPANASNVPKARAMFPNYVSAPVKTLHKGFFTYFFQHLIQIGIFYQRKRKDPAKRFRTPEELAKIIDLKYIEDPMTENTLLTETDKIIQFSAHQAHPFWVYQLFTGLNPYTLIGDYIVSVLDSGMENFESSPVYSLAEEEVLHGVRKLIGYPDGEGDGVINPGGTMSNIMGITLARHKMTPEVKDVGVQKTLVLYLNIGGHYSFNKGAFLLGLGLQHCVLVKADEYGRMDLNALKEAIEKTKAEGKVPFMVAATAGTTVIGSIDPLQEIAAICKEHNMWFHVDGVFGGAILYSETARKKLAGIELSDSLTFNPHKMFGATMTMSVFVTRHKGIIRQAVGVAPDASVGPHDRGDGHYIGARRANGFKFWLLWKAQGTKGLGQHIDYVLDNTQYAVQLMRERNDSFHMITPDFDITNVCFLYVPAQYRLLEKGTPQYMKVLDPITSQIQMQLVKDGIMDIVVQKTSGMETPTFMKLVLMSSATNKEDIKYLLDQIDYYGKNM